jgi:hypothetical protein
MAFNRFTQHETVYPGIVWVRLHCGVLIIRYCRENGFAQDCFRRSSGLLIEWAIENRQYPG